MALPGLCPLAGRAAQKAVSAAMVKDLDAVMRPTRWLGRILDDLEMKVSFPFFDLFRYNSIQIQKDI